MAELGPAGSFVNKQTVRCSCGSGSKKNVNHVLFRCLLTNAAHRDELPTADERHNESGRIGENDR